MKFLHMILLALFLSGPLHSVANAGMVVQFKGQTDPVTQNKTIADAQTIAGVDLLQDTSLIQTDLDIFDAALNANFLGCYTIPMLDPETWACRIYEHRPRRCREFPERLTPGCQLSELVFDAETG